MDKSQLFEKITLNNGTVVPNHLAIAPLTLFSSNPDGTINDEEREYLKLRATNIGLYILGAQVVSKEGITAINFPGTFCDKDLPSIKERADIVKSQGALAINQIHHGGALALKQYSGMTPVVPSKDIAVEEAKKRGADTDMHELTDNEINEIIEKFANATELSIKAGYDGVEIHGANNYLIQQFYSPHTNKRKDNWGGSDEKRMNFALKIVDAVCKIREKHNCPKFIIGYRLSPEEPYEDGITMTETLKLIKTLVQKPIQYIHISQKDYFKKTRRGEGIGIERLKLIHDITKDKVALIGVGGLKSEKNIYDAFKTGFSEFIAVGVASMLNPDFAILLKEGKGDKINLELDPQHPELYKMPKHLWEMCLEGQDWLPPIKGKTYNLNDD
jgi:2,4-dienoyl-CoA reductase-like NADH-dependent reductase (Old Yellow Enzyme family)